MKLFYTECSDQQLSCDSAIPSSEDRNFYLKQAQLMVDELSQEYVDRLARYQRLQDIKLSLAGRLMALHVCKDQQVELFGNEPAVENKFRFKTDHDTGRPVLYLHDRQLEPCWNISHDGTLTVFAIDTQCELLGIDVMCYYGSNKSHDVIYYEELSECFTQSEWNHICHQTKFSTKLFYIYWTLKESFMKALSVGIANESRLSMKDIEFTIDDNSGEWKVANFQVKSQSSVNVNNNNVCKTSEWRFDIRFLESSKTEESYVVSISSRRRGGFDVFQQKSPRKIAISQHKSFCPSRNDDK